MISYMLWLDTQLAFRVAYITNYMTHNEGWLDAEEEYSLLLLAHAMLLQRTELLAAVEALQAASLVL